jgi:hypothetical protein
MKRKYTYRQLLKNRGCYAELIFEINLIPGAENDLDVKYLADKRWEFSCKSGLQIFHDYFMKKMSGRLEIIIHEIKWLPVDTNNLIVLFATILAVSDVFKLNIPYLELDLVNETFHLPEARAI